MLTFARHRAVMTANAVCLADEKLMTANRTFTHRRLVTFEVAIKRYLLRSKRLKVRLDGLQNPAICRFSTERLVECRFVLRDLSSPLNHQPSIGLHEVCFRNVIRITASISATGRRPSQYISAPRDAFTTVGVFRKYSVPGYPLDNGKPSAQLCLGSRHVAQLVVASPDRRGSKKRSSPIRACPGSAAAAGLRQRCQWSRGGIVLS